MEDYFPSDGNLLLASFILYEVYTGFCSTCLLKLQEQFKFFHFVRCFLQDVQLHQNSQDPR